MEDRITISIPSGYASHVDVKAGEDRLTISIPSRYASLVDVKIGEDRITISIPSPVFQYIAMNKDALTEILLRLPVQSLLRFRAVCKFWGNVIDSPSFRKLHTQNDNININKSDDTVYLQVSFPNPIQVNLPNVQKKLSIKLQRKVKSLMLYESDHLNSYLSCYRMINNDIVSLVGAVKGLICFNPHKVEMPVAICNPFLGQLKILPLITSSSSNSSCGIYHREVAIGFDEDYKVVQLLSCSMHHRLHAQLYSRRTGSWRELAGDGCVGFSEVSSIKSRCMNGYFAHWRVCRRNVGGDVVSKILSLDMKNEVFRTITLPADYTTRSSIFAEDEHSFRRFDFHFSGFLFAGFENDNLVEIYESRCEGSQLNWNHVMNVKLTFCGSPRVWRTGCVFFPYGFVYDYRARKFIWKLSEPELWLFDQPSEFFVEYRGSFVSLED